jgi:pyruvate/2-oxoglutarate dehydrogenase complex dihydrolipoamide dehydrogenase (E3) component
MTKPEPHKTKESSSLPVMRGTLNPKPVERYNLVVLGGGPAGLMAAAGAADLGARVALIEMKLPGGGALRAGAIPAKALIRAASAAHELRRCADLGIRLRNGFETDFPAIMQRAQTVNARAAQTYNFDKLLDRGVDIFLGRGLFTDPSHIEVNGQIIPFAKAVIAVGTTPARPDIPGIEDVQTISGDDLFRLQGLPKRLAVLGADPFGCEMAQAFARLGSEVAIYDQKPQILDPEDADAAQIIQNAMEADGVNFRLGWSTLRTEAQGKGAVIHSEVGGRWFADTFDTVLVAAGRKPMLDGLGLDAAQVKYDAQGIRVTPFLKTSSGRIYAAGDVCAPFGSTHAADAMARIVIANALFFGTDRMSSVLVPRCVWTDPQLAHLGVYTAQTEMLHLKTLSLPFDDLDSTIINGGTGLLKIHHDHRGTIRGATLVGAQATEVIGEITLAMNHGIRLGALHTDLLPYPTEAEILKRASDVYRHNLVTPAVAGFFRKLMEWRR